MCFFSYDTRNTRRSIIVSQTQSYKRYLNFSISKQIIDFLGHRKIHFKLVKLKLFHVLIPSSICTAPSLAIIYQTFKISSKISR